MKLHPKPRVGGLYSPCLGSSLKIHACVGKGPGNWIKLTCRDIIMITHLEIHHTPVIGGNQAECYFITFIYNEKIYEEWMTFPLFWTNNFRDAGDTGRRTLT